MDSLRFLSASPFSDVPDRSSHRLKLNQFHVDAKDVQIKRIIGRGEQGVVFSAEIEGQIYALKVFRELCPYGPESMSKRDQMTWLWPFANECRAFARLHQSGLNGVIAVKCHGWMKLTDDQLQRVRRLAKDVSLSPWSIVKDLINENTGLEDIPFILQSIDRLHKERILIADTRPDNFKGKYWIDLGSAQTYPHPFWNKFEEDAFYRSAKYAVTHNWHFENGSFKYVLPLLSPRSKDGVKKNAEESAEESAEENVEGEMPQSTLSVNTDDVKSSDT